MPMDPQKVELSTLATPRREKAIANAQPAPVLHGTGFTDASISVYFETFSPSFESTRPVVVMIHGGAHSGACYQHTADRRPGWAYVFAERGYRVVVPDWPGIGRSGHIPVERLTGELVVEGLSALLKSINEPVVLVTHSMSGCYGWRLTELHREMVEAVIGVAPSPPGNLQASAPIFEENEDAVETLMSGQRVRIPKNALITRTEEYVSRKFIGQSRYFPHERLSSYTASLLGVPSRIAMQRWNVHGAQVRIEHPSKLSGKRILVLCGSDDLDHPREVDEPLVGWLNEHGAKAEFCFLSDRGIVGNGHMLMLESNSDAVAGIMLDWLEAN